MDAERIRTLAERLAAENRLNDESVERVLWFPDDRELRLIETTREIAASPEGKVVPFYFRAEPGYPIVSAIALIQPEEAGRLILPDGWGDWNSAIELSAPAGALG